MLISSSFQAFILANSRVPNTRKLWPKKEKKKEKRKKTLQFGGEKSLE